MTFITPALAVAGAAAVAIPILIHLLSRQRRRPIEWAAMRFLLEAFRKQRRRLRLEQFLLLLARCLIVVLVGFALARPILEQAGVLNTGGSRIVYLIIDDGMISGLTDAENESALARHKASAREIIEHVGASDRVGVITAARPARAVLSPPSSDHRAVRSLIDGFEPQSAPTDLPAALSELSRAIESIDHSNDSIVVYLLSEFRTGSAALDEALPGSLKALDDRVTLLAAAPAEQPVGNIQVSGIEPMRNVLIGRASDGGGLVNVHLERHGGVLERDVTRVRLRGEGLVAPEPRVIQWEPGQSDATVEFNLRLDVQDDRTQAISASIDDDALIADNTRAELLHLRTHLRAILLDRRSFGFEPSIDRFQAGQWIRRALEPIAAGPGGAGSPVQIVEVDPSGVSAADVRTAEIALAPRPDLITSDGWAILRAFVDDGGLLLVMPPAELNVHPWTESFTESMDLPWRFSLEVAEHPDGLTLAAEQPTTPLLQLISAELEDLMRPVVALRTLPLHQESGAGETVLEFSNGSALVSVASPQTDGAEETADDESAPQSSSVSHGMVVYWSVAPELSWTNLPTKPLMVPLLHELVRQGVGAIHSQQRLQLGAPMPIPGAGSARVLVDPEGEVIALDHDGRPREPLRRAGVYELRDDADQSVGLLALNVDPSAGRTETQSSSAVLAWLQTSGAWSVVSSDNPAAPLQVAEQGSHLAGILLITLLVLVLIETVLARWFSHATAEETAGGRGGLTPTIRARSARAEMETLGGSAPSGGAR